MSTTVSHKLARERQVKDQLHANISKHRAGFGVSPGVLGNQAHRRPIASVPRYHWYDDPANVPYIRGLSTAASIASNLAGLYSHAKPVYGLAAQLAQSAWSPQGYIAKHTWNRPGPSRGPIVFNPGVPRSQAGVQAAINAVVNASAAGGSLSYRPVRVRRAKPQVVAYSYNTRSRAVNRVV